MLNSSIAQKYMRMQNKHFMKRFQSKRSGKIWFLPHLKFSTRNSQKKQFDHSFDVRYKYNKEIKNADEKYRIGTHMYFVKSSTPYVYEKGPLDTTYTSKERAFHDFLLTDDDLKPLKTFKMRSAYGSNMYQISDYYLKKDVVDLAVNKFGSMDLLKAATSTHSTSHDSKDDVYQNLASALNKLKNMEISIEAKTNKLMDDSALVQFSIAGNLIILGIKIIAFSYTNSGAILAEIIHSLLDIFTQALRYIGIVISQGKPSRKHPYGYSKALYAFSLSSSIFVFFFGCLFPAYNSFANLFTGGSIDNADTGITLMLVCGIIELFTMLISMKKIKTNATKNNLTFFQYIKNSSDPTATSLFLEDSVSIIGIGFAYLALLASNHLNSSFPDFLGGLGIALLMGCVSSFQMKNNYEILVGQSIPYNKIDKIIEFLENDKLILSVNDYKATYDGKNQVRFKAEISINGRELTKVYLHNTDMSLMSEDLKNIQTEKQLRRFLLLNGDNLIDLLGCEVDRIEMNIKKKFPEIRHIDLEIS